MQCLPTRGEAGFHQSRSEKRRRNHDCQSNFPKSASKHRANLLRLEAMPPCQARASSEMCIGALLFGLIWRRQSPHLRRRHDCHRAKQQRASHEIFGICRRPWFRTRDDFAMRDRRRSSATEKSVRIPTGAGMARILLKPVHQQQPRSGLPNESETKACSIGLRSGEYGGRYQSLAPTARMARRTPADLWLPRLSITTMSPLRRAGASCCST